MKTLTCVRAGLTWRPESPSLVIVEVRVPCCEAFSGEEGVGYCTTRTVERVAVVVIGFGEVDLDVRLVARHLVEVERRDVAPHLQSVVHQGSNRFPP